MIYMLGGTFSDCMLKPKYSSTVSGESKANGV